MLAMPGPGWPLQTFKEGRLYTNLYIIGKLIEALPISVFHLPSKLNGNKKVEHITWKSVLFCYGPLCVFSKFNFYKEQQILHIFLLLYLSSRHIIL